MSVLIDDLNLAKQIQRLNKQHLQELQLFVTFLLSKQQGAPVSQDSRNKVVHSNILLADLESIPLPVDNFIIDRAELYGDRV